jgi:chromosomal replication initiator protein
MDNDRAIEFSVLAVRAFAKVRQTSDSQNMLAKRVDHLESSFQEFKQIFVRLESKIDAYFGSTHRHQPRLPDYVSTVTVHSVVFAGKTQVDEIEKTLAIVAKYFGVEVTDLKTTTRVKSVAVPRQIAIYLIRKRVGIGFKEIGKCFGGKDHTTILYAYRKISDAVCKGGPICESVAAIENSIKAGAK